MKSFFIVLLAVGLSGLASIGCDSEPKAQQTLSIPQNPAERQLADTLRVIEKRLAENPTDPQLYYVRGKIKLELGDTVQALADLEKAVNLEPDNEEYLYGNAELAYIRGKDQQALDYLKRAVAQKTQRPEAYHLMGNVYLLQKNYTQALANMDRAIDLDKTQPIFYLGKALIYRQMKQPQRAITFANYALERNKAFLKAAALAADIHLNEVYDPKEARRYVYYILEADSLHPVGHYYMGYVLYRQAAETGDRSLYKPLMNKAIEEYSQAIKADPTYNDARYQRGYLYQQLDKLDKATADYKAVLERNPQDARAAFQLGSLYEYYKDYSRALKYYRQALQAKPDFAEARQAIQELERNLPDKK